MKKLNEIARKANEAYGCSKLKAQVLAGEEGGAQGTVEYVVVLGLVVLIVIAALSGLFETVATKIGDIKTAIENTLKFS